MRSYLEHILGSFYAATGWNVDNHYANLTASSRDLLDFELPSGFILNVSSLPTGSSASSGTLKNLGGVVDGAISYFYSSPQNILLENKLRSESVDLTDFLCGYHQLHLPEPAEDPVYREMWRGGRRVDSKYSLLYGKLYLPGNTLESMLIRQFTPTDQIVVSAVSDKRIQNGGALMAQLQHNSGRWCSEMIYSSHEALLGFRGLYNFSVDSHLPELPSGIASIPGLSASSLLFQPQQSWFSAGGEIYYGALNKAAGVSIGLRYATTSSLVGTPTTTTFTLNPVMGQMSVAYAVQASTSTSFASRFDFNAFSYESNLTLGFELWKNKNSRDEIDDFIVSAPAITDRSGDQSEAKTETPETLQPEVTAEGADTTQPISMIDDSVWKIRVATDSPSVRLLWEGRIKAFLFSVGADISLHRDQGMKTFGLELQYAA
ncbi:hypothetical protein BZA70DRAFT_276930 [Myxozyma melibiosi]|uniref:Mitochondrial distribution and morphology protein 10 n=1 Tax=Myxozyma melibiosi TaxID=54550 RepID=A0ABR1F7F3_9ASCO